MTTSTTNAPGNMSAGLAIAILIQAILQRYNMSLTVDQMGALTTLAGLAAHGTVLLVKRFLTSPSRDTAGQAQPSTAN